MIRVTSKTNNEYLVNLELADFDYKMENRGPEMFVLDTHNRRLFAMEIESWTEVGSKNE